MTEIELIEMGDRFGDFVEFISRDIQNGTEFRWDANIAMTDKWKDLLKQWRTDLSQHMNPPCDMEDCDQYEDGKCTYDNH